MNVCVPIYAAWTQNGLRHVPHMHLGANDGICRVSAQIPRGMCKNAFQDLQNVQQFFKPVVST